MNFTEEMLRSYKSQTYSYDYNPKAEMLRCFADEKHVKTFSGSNAHFAAAQVAANGNGYNLIIDSKMNNE